MTAPWQGSWFAAAAPARMQAWRGVEAQHIVSTLRLVDTLEEELVLERLLESSKPALPTPAAPGATRSRRLRSVAQTPPPEPHFLLSTPFRYRPPHASRFRRAGSRGVWYGAEPLRAACAEVAFWRWRFLLDSEGLAGQALLTEHSFFMAQLDGLALDLTRPPWSEQRALWTHPDDYAACHALADEVQARSTDPASAAGGSPPITWIRYESARDPGGACAAALSVAALASVDLASQQTWHCKTTKNAVLMVHGVDRHEWRF